MSVQKSYYKRVILEVRLLSIVIFCLVLYYINLYIISLIHAFHNNNIVFKVSMSCFGFGYC